jgi:hypothetical protein
MAHIELNDYAADQYYIIKSNETIKLLNQFSTRIDLLHKDMDILCKTHYMNYEKEINDSMDTFIKLVELSDIEIMNIKNMSVKIKSICWRLKSIDFSITQLTDNLAKFNEIEYKILEANLLLFGHQNDIPEIYIVYDKIKENLKKNNDKIVELTNERLKLKSELAYFDEKINTDRDKVLNLMFSMSAILVKCKTLFK